MLSAGIWTPNQANLIHFVMVDSSNAEVAGLGAALTIQIAKSGGTFVAGAGTKGEIGLGWYWYLSTPGEASTIGPVSVAVVGLGTVQQNLEYVCGVRSPSSIEFTYTLTDSTMIMPLPGADIWFTIDSSGVDVVWSGSTDLFGVARDANGGLPRLDPGTYYVWRRLTGWTFADPDVEVVS